MEQINPQERRESSLTAKIKRTGAFLGKLLRRPTPITGRHLDDALANASSEHQVVQPLLKPAVKPDVTGKLQAAEVHLGDGNILQDAPVDEKGIMPNPPTEKPAWAVDKPAGGVSADAQPLPPVYAVTERPGGVPAGEPIPPYAVTRRPGGDIHQ